MAEPSSAPARWGGVLDDLDARVTAAESGDLAALEGWAPPAAQPSAMTSDEQHRARGVLARQQALLARLRDERQTVAASMAAVRRPRYRPSAAPPVYVDRIG